MAKNRHRWKIQLGATLAANPFLLNFFQGKISRGRLKGICVPGLNCYSCPAAAASCPIGAVQAVIGSSKYHFAYYVVGFLLFIGVLLAISVITVILDLVNPELYNDLVVKNDLLNKLAKPSPEHILGCDEYGRDLLFRILWGTRYSLFAGVVTILAAILVGGTIGSIAGYYGKIVDNCIMRVMDMMMTVPSLVLAMALVAALGPSLVNLLIALSVSQIPQFARIVRSSVLSVKDAEYIEAARAVGASDVHIILLYIVPKTPVTIVPN